MIPALLALLLLALPAAAQPERPGEAPPGKPAGPPSAEAQGPRDIIVRNRSDSVLRSIFAIEPGQRGPGRDRLGADVIPSGRDYPLRLGPGPCRIELRAVFEDGGAETRAVDACTAGELVFDDRDARAVEIVNNTDFDLRELYLSRPGAVGPDRLGANIVPANDSLRIRLRGERECAFEARAVFQGAPREESQRVDICATPRIVFGDASIPLRELPVVNRSPRVLVQLYASTGPEWGPDRLGVNVLRPGQGFLLRIRTAECRVRLRALFDDRRSEEREAVDVCAPQQVALGAPRRVTLAHAHGRAVRELYLSAVEEDDWGPDRLAGAPLAPGQSREFEMAGGCRADIRVVFDNGNAEELREVDICARPAITIRPGWTVE
jgi:hypothetical protein